MRLTYRPDFYEVGRGTVVDEGKLAAIVRHVFEHASPEDQASALEHPGLDLRLRADGMVEVVSAERVIGAFDRAILVP